jgi:formylglycine-generating enzyme required for sulfatase activity
MKTTILASVLALTLAPIALAQGCIGDIVADSRVDGADLGTLLAYWGPRTNASFSIASDLNVDGRIDGADLGIMLANWGVCPGIITSVSPLQGGTQGGTVILITGTGLASTTDVKIGSVACTDLNVLTPTLVRATTPPGAAGESSIAVTTATGTTIASSPFNYVLQQVTSIVPNTGPYVGGTPITINGQHLAGATAVTIGGLPCTNVVAVSSMQVTAVTPAGSVGAVAVVVTCPKGSVTVTNGFEFLPNVPTWASIIDPLPSPAVIPNPLLRQRIVDAGWAWRVRHNATGIEMLLIPAGDFEMGESGFGEPVHTVRITKPLYVSRFEVTQAQWSLQIGSNPSIYKNYQDSPSRPVENVSWDSVQSFLGQTQLRLLTEAEWEYAYRAGTTTPFHSCPDHPSGFDDWSEIGLIGWHGYNSGWEPQAVGQLAPNGFGLHDMAGNVWEWVGDWYGEYLPGMQVDPTGPASGTTHVIRGGSAIHIGWQLRASIRGTNPPNTYPGQYGFRVARNP